MTSSYYIPIPAKILNITRETAIDYTYRLEWPVQPEPGQFFEVSVPRFGEAPFSISGFGDGYLDMTIRNVGQVTSAIFDMQVGDLLYLRGPYGHGFQMRQYMGKSLIIAAGGTGLAPVKPVINYFTSHLDEIRRFDVLLGFKSPDDILFSDEIEHWSKKTNVQVTVDLTAECWSGNVGLITELIKDIEIADPGNTEAIVVGPPLMMKYSVLGFQQRGLTSEQITLSLERRMSCGVGKCGHCKIMDNYVCLDGPVFNYAQAQWLID